MGIRLSARYQWQDPDSPPFLDKTFAGPRITIGNDPAASMCLNGSVLSPEQIVIIEGASEPQLINKAEGTSLNGEVLALDVSRPLKDGDVLCLGTYRIDIFFDQTLSPLESANDIVSERRSPDIRRGIGEDIIEDPVPVRDTRQHSLLPSDELTGLTAGGNHREKSSKSFAAILDSLRTDEDRFYFVIDGGQQSGARIPIEYEEMPLGWDETGEYVSFDISTIADLCAIVRKDWSGVVIRAQAASVIAVNNELLQEERRLRDGDRIMLRRADREARTASQLMLIFREPTSLVILDSLMPRTAPTREAAAIPSAKHAPAGGSVRLEINKMVEKVTAVARSDREYFSAFTAIELSLMAVGTIFGALIIFLILNYS